MAARTLYSIVESPTHPDFSALYRRLGIDELRLPSLRKAIAALRSRLPDIVVAEFFYGYGSNYAGVNVCNLDVFLYSLQKYRTAARIIVLVGPAESRHVARLAALFPLHAVLVHPVSERDIEARLAP